MKPVFLAAVAVGLVSCGASEPQVVFPQLSKAFDLRCIGTTTSIAGGEKEHSLDVLHVDLERNLWCRDECGSLHKIASTDPGFIDFAKPDNWGPVTIRLNRLTGGFEETFAAPEIGFITKSQCVRQPFTPFPKARF